MNKKKWIHLDARLAAVARLVPAGASFADIGTDHAYLPLYLCQRGITRRAVAGDIAAGPCQAARRAVALYGEGGRVEVRQGSGLKVLAPGEAECIAICGMGGATIKSILAADMDIARSAGCLVLQPMNAAAGLRRYLAEQGWELVREDLAEDPPRLYEIICAACAPKKNFAQDTNDINAMQDAAKADAPHYRYGGYTEAQYEAGPALLRDGHPLLEKHLQRLCEKYRALLREMERSAGARASEKYRAAKKLLEDLEVMADGQASHAE